MKRRAQKILMIATIFITCSCSGAPAMKPDFDQALQGHLQSITNRDIEAFKSRITKNPALYTIVQNGHAFKTPEELIALHEGWFKDKSWIWEGEVVHKVVGTDMAMAVIKYKYRAKLEDVPFETWLTYVFALEDGAWKIIHDQNTTLDFAAFEKSMKQNAQ